MLALNNLSNTKLWPSACPLHKQRTLEFSAPDQHQLARNALMLTETLCCAW